MRYLPAILDRIFKTVPLMDTQTEARRADPIARDLDAAVSEHVRVASEVSEEYSDRLKQTLDDLFRKLDNKDDARG